MPVPARLARPFQQPMIFEASSKDSSPSEASSPCIFGAMTD